MLALLFYLSRHLVFFVFFFYFSFVFGARLVG